MAPDLTPRQHATGSGIAGVTIRRVSSLAEYDECVRMQHETWGEQFTESVSATVLRITQEMGGVTAAAFRADGYMLGFVFGITGVRSGELAHWSDMLAVRPAARDMGLGARLKHYQRDLVREIGVRTMYWTYDPLVARNAHLNLERLGARAVEYRPAFYGENTGSVMHAGLGTDRFIVRWDVTCSIEELVAALPARSNAPIVNRASAAGVPGDGDLPDLPEVRVAIPRDIFAVLEHMPDIAHRWRATTRRALESYLGRGYHVVAFQRDDSETGGTYVLRAI